MPQTPMQSEPGAPVLRVENLSVEFPVHKGLVHAVKDVSFSIGRGETLCVVGESGSGKSVTARAILQLIAEPGRITNGRILLKDKDGAGETDIVALGNRGRAIREIRGRRIAMIFQEPMSSLSPVHTIGRQITETILLHEKVDKAEARRRAAALLDRVRIPNPEEALDRYSFEFSGGMRQRAMIAMALSCNPEILIADEPTTALDVTTQAEILALIRELQRDRGMAVLFITHDMGVVAQIADRVMVMFKGEKVEEADVFSLFEKPQQAYTRALLGSILKLERPAPRPPRPEAEKPIARISDLELHFPLNPGFMGRPTAYLKAINGVSLTINEGESVGVVGESGSGKTTLGRTLLRVYTPTSGKVDYWRGEGGVVDLASLSRREMKALYGEVRMIFQDPHASLNPRMTIYQIISEPLRTNTDMTERQMQGRVRDLLTRVGLPADISDRYPHAFSGGQRQRISIARAIAVRPRLIIADEPTSALDVSLRHQVLDLMRDLQAEYGLSYLFISHDIAVIRYFCDRVAVMKRGQIVEMGDVVQVCENPVHEYTRTLISAVPRPDPRLRLQMAG
ncbi:ABC transporter ATP-binding protein [Arsenicitalea aurantiaca]|uniref:ABC transporter ATP-binding protein n=1 Tax=Arsenicitalea aurantiaca TaxID=1783274 RepID=A0A433XB18_9HYPH|nr:ABC transporter ATP-binding protein [Arsenicitalea aurantiaca]RUT31291.1 ABC transporter ATP-binding protein [Arsenicitalea aurantiaca]